MPEDLSTEPAAVLERLRRSPSDTWRTSNALEAPGGVLIDYASAGVKIDAACAALDEGIPNKQPIRVEYAYRLLVQGVQELGVWLRANGYDA